MVGVVSMKNLQTKANNFISLQELSNLLYNIYSTMVPNCDIRRSVNIIHLNIIHSDNKSLTA